MHRFSVSNFFSLEGFAHKALWQEEALVWEALSSLLPYLEQPSPRKIEIQIPPNVTIVNPELVSIGEGTILEPGVLIEGPCILGKGCQIRHGAFLRGGVICGDRSVIGHATEVKHSILLNGAQAAHLNYVGDSILGANVNLGAGVKCANLRLDRQEISLFNDGVRINTHLKKLGCILGDGCQIGCNVVFNPGTILGPNCISYPLLNLQGIIPAHSRIKRKEPHFEVESSEAVGR